MKSRLKMLGNHWRQLAELLGDTSSEQAAFLLTSSVVGVNETILLVREVVPLTEPDFTVKKYDQISVAPQAMLRVLRKAQKLGCGVCMVHTHPMAISSVSFSTADNIGNQTTFGYYCQMLPDQVHSCLVFNGALTLAQGRVYSSGSHWRAMECIEVLEDHEHRLISDKKAASLSVGEAYMRQVLLLGEEGQRELSRLRVVLIGAGGLGSVAAMILGHSGVGWLGLVDPDITKKHNRPRQVGSRDSDIDAVSKVEVMGRYLRESCPDTKVELFDLSVQDEALQAYLASAHVIVCTTDTDASRAYVNEIGHRYLVPVADLGVQFDADPATGMIRSDIGKINLMLPGTPCLLCTGHLNPLKITWESLPDVSKHNQIRDGYSRNWHLPQPSMMPFNSEVAARAAQLIIGYFTKLLPAVPGVYERFTFLNHHDLRHHSLVRKRGETDCIICSQAQGVVGHGSPLREKPPMTASAF